MTVSGARLRPGDVLEVDCDPGVALLGYLGKHAGLGDLVWVLPRIFAPPVSDHCSRFSGAGYFQFYPATTALRQGIARKVGFCVEAMRVVPSRICRAINMNEDGTVRTWNVVDGSEVTVRAKLSEEERQLPVAVIVNHPALLDKIRTGWTPERYHVRP